MNANYENDNGKFISKAGEFEAEIIACKVEGDYDDPSKITYTFETAEGKLINNYTLPKFGWLMKKMLLSCGFTEAQLNDFDPESAVGMNCIIAVSEKSSERDPDVKFYNITGTKPSVNPYSTAPWM